jgi:hypothetical protein
MKFLGYFLTIIFSILVSLSLIGVLAFLLSDQYEDWKIAILYLSIFISSFINLCLIMWWV